MHMADALISPEVGGTMLSATVVLLAYSTAKVKKEMDEKKIPLMGVMGAFIFAAQMVNFSIPGTGSSGHLVGALLLAAILGPYAGTLSMAAILLIQALCFADGGLLAYGCNVINLAFYTSFITYPLIFKTITAGKISKLKIMIASLVAAVVGLQLGAFSVVLETFFSGKVELPFQTFVLLMQPIHLAIGFVEGIITGLVLNFVRQARPEILDQAAAGRPSARFSIRNLAIVLAMAALFCGGVLSWFASPDPDGLEWALEKGEGLKGFAAPQGIHQTFSSLQEKTAFLPDYAFKSSAAAVENQGNHLTPWPNPKAETTISGIIGGMIVFVLASLSGLTIWLVKKRKTKKAV